MKVIVPLSNIKECQSLINLGADEFYCGFNEKLSVISFNRRELEIANFESFNELCNVADMCRENNIPLNITLNKIYYTQEEFEYVIKLIDRLVDIKVNGIIISDMGLIHHIFKHQYDKLLHIQLSSVASVFNTKALSFYMQYNFSRVILPRNLSIEEIALFRKYHEDTEFEVFILNWSCTNIDGLCNTQHDLNSCSGSLDGITNNQCCLSYDIQFLNENNINLDDKKSILYQVKNRFTDVASKSSRTCGVCFLYTLKEIGINHVKIVGRLLNKAQKIKSLKFINECLSLSNISKTKKDYAVKARKLYKLHFGFQCQYNCYFSSSINGKKSAVF